jgi:hypothetical protein
MSANIRGRGLRALCWSATLAVLALSGACSNSMTQPTAPVQSSAAFASQVISPPTLSAGQLVPRATEKPVFTVTGRIAVQNRDGALVFDRPTLDRLGVRQVRLYEPWTKEHLDFRGVWLQDLLAVAGVKPGATKLHIVALDDYAVDLKLADVLAGGIMIATSAGDGSAIPIDQGGPTRVVFMDGVEAGVNPDQWVWSLKAIDVV